MPLKIRITLIAMQDLKSIGRYSAKNWGKNKRNIYLKNINETFNYLAINPNMGRNRGEIRTNLRSFGEGSHTIYYTSNSEKIEIIRILHHSMEPDSKL